MDEIDAKTGLQNVELLSSVDDDHEGVIVEMKEKLDSQAFASLLRASLSHWKQQGKKGVWLKLPIALVNLVEVAVKEGFWYHHAEPHYLMLVFWIPKMLNTIPANASHRVAVGAIVINEKRELLVVQEKNGKLRGTGVWKIPTGIVEEGEDIFVGAVREVKEETAIDTEFIEILAFRQFHKLFFDKSDLFFLCVLRPLSFNIQKQELEIEAAQWMPIEEYAAQPVVKEHTFFKCIADFCLAMVDKKSYAGFRPLPMSSFSNDRAGYLYASANIVSK